MIKQPIKSAGDYEQMLLRVTVLAAQDPSIGSKGADELELLSILLEDYERKSISIDMPDPIEAIEFRMQEQGLERKDLIPILGSKSRVSEVLARKRPLSLQMIRSLAEGLAIPTDVLIQESRAQDVGGELDWRKFPFKEMQRRGWIPEAAGASANQAVAKFIEGACQNSMHAMFRRRLRGQGMDNLEDKAFYAAIAWTARVRTQARSIRLHQHFTLSELNDQFLRNLVSLSPRSDGPARAVDCLREIGIKVVIEQQLTGSLLDGAAMLDEEGNPIIALSLRYDRLDYFWFTLAHEIAHVKHHLNHANEAFVDRLIDTEDKERVEREANRIARDMLIPRDIWQRSSARYQQSVDSVLATAAQLGVHPAIVAGRLRYESGNYSRHTRLIGQGVVRSQFLGR